MNAWIVFAKEPEPGKVKTRLTPPLAPEDAVRLYTAFVEDVCGAIQTARAAGDRCVLAAPGGAGPVLARIAAERGFETAPQEGADLGARMRHALGRELARGAQAAVLVGSDSPTLPAASLHEAVQRLREHPAVLGPAGDGGYWLVGAAGAVPDLFEGVPWSTRDVLAATLARAKERRVSLDLLPFWYDVDDAADLRLLTAHLEHPDAKGTAPRTSAAIAELRARQPEVFRW